MAPLGSWVKPFPEGIYVKPADAWIDPSQPKPRAMITHGHGDHARGGHSEVFATAETLAIMACRYGPQPGGRAIAYGETIRLGEVEVSFVPAGHVLGSPKSCSGTEAEAEACSGAINARPDPPSPPSSPGPAAIFLPEPPS